MTQHTLIISIIFLTWTITSSICSFTGPLSAGAFRITFNSSLPWESGRARDVTIEYMTSDWTVDTSNANIQTTLVAVQGTPNVLYAQDFENSTFDSFSYITNGANQSTTLSVVTTEKTKGSTSSAMLTDGFHADFAGPWINLANATPARLSAYMRASSAGIGGPSMAVSFRNSTGVYPAAQVFFDSDNNIKMKRLSSPGNVTFSNSTPFSPNKWYKIDIIISWSNNTVGFWVDGFLVAQNFPFFYGGQNVPYVNGINLWNYNSTISYIDEIEVVSSEVALADFTVSTVPGSTSVKNGIWTGTVTISTLQSNLQLRAYRSTSSINYDGFSAKFNVVSISPSPSPSPSRVPSASVTPSASPSPSTNPSSAVTPSTTPSVTPSVTPSPSFGSPPSPSISPSSAVTPSTTPSVTPSASFVPTTDTTANKKDNTQTIAIATGVSAGAFCLLGIVFFGLVTKKMTRTRERRLTKGGSLEMPSKPVYVASHVTESDHRSMSIKYTDLMIGREIGRGAFGSVFVATWRNSDCVVKQMNIDNTDTQAVSDFLKEADMVLRLRPHKNVCQIFGVCTNPEYPICIVMEYVAGGSLKELVYEPTKLHLTFPLILNFAKDIVSGMIHIHAENLLHCDLACRNLLAATQGENSWTIKVSDFGLARNSESGTYNAKQEAKFPIRWSAPEVLSNRKVSRASDVWSFGVVLWELLEGRLPFYELMNNNDVILAVCTKKEFLAAPTKRVDYPDQLYELMVSCWAYNPEERPSFEDIYAKLLSFEPHKKIMETEELVPVSSGTHDYHEFNSVSEFTPKQESNSNYQSDLIKSNSAGSRRKEWSQSIYGNKGMEQSQEIEEV